MERQTEPTNAQSTKYQLGGLHVRSVWIGCRTGEKYSRPRGSRGCECPILIPNKSPPSGGAEHSSSKAPINFNSDESPRMSNRDLGRSPYYIA